VYLWALYDSLNKQKLSSKTAFKLLFVIETSYVFFEAWTELLTGLNIT
jgi:hypothetical protein